MSFAKKIKEHSVCRIHDTNQRSSVCFHLYESILSGRDKLEIVPLFIERVLIDRYYEKYWFCEQCANAHNISLNGELHFDPVLRALLNDERNCMDHAETSIKVELDPGLKSLIKLVCRGCLVDKYGEKITDIESAPETLLQIEKI